MPTLVDLTIYKVVDGQPSNTSWTNVYHLEVADGVADASTKTVVDAIVAFEKSLHLNDVLFERAVVRTHAAEGRKGHPEAFKSYALSGHGNNVAASNDADQDSLPTEHVLKVLFTASAGRTGSKLYRRCVASNMWTNVGGRPSLTWATKDQWIESINNSLDPAIIGQMRILSVDDAGNVVPRVVEAVQVSGLATRQLTQPRKKKGSASNDEGLAGQLGKIGIEVAGVIGAVTIAKAAGKLVESPAALTAAEALGARLAQLLPLLGAA
jgi:hypothetical protein